MPFKQQGIIHFIDNQSLNCYNVDKILTRNIDYNLIAKSIIALKKADLDFRDLLIQKGELGNGYHKDMQQLHIENAQILNEIIDEIGFPTIDWIGEEASDAAWLVIQHSIALPAFMKKCKVLLEQAVAEKKASAKNLAYLSDRISAFEGKPQHYGTQFDWDENGMLSPVLSDDINEVNRRRTEIGLNTLEDQTKLIRQRAKIERQQAPTDLQQRNREAEDWKKSVGWIL